MEKELKPYMFTRTLLTWATDEEDAKNQLQALLVKIGNSISDWSCDEISSDDLVQENDSPADFS